MKIFGDFYCRNRNLCYANAFLCGEKKAEQVVSVTVTTEAQLGKMTGSAGGAYSTLIKNQFCCASLILSHGLSSVLLFPDCF